ncbi:MAG: Zn-ribbon domain-containing OB-fold protein [Anaerolineales bacterium]
MADPRRSFPKPLPQPTPETQEFWDGTKAGELRLQRCNECSSVYFPPRPFCPKCASRSVTWFKASGKGTLHSYVINHRPAPGFQDEAPYAIAVVELEEGPRMMTNMVGVEQTPEALVLDMPVEVSFVEANEQITLPKFRPAGGGK